jgi:hypothetical protein
MAKTTLLAGLFMAFAPNIGSAQPIEAASTSYVAHLVFRPLMSTDGAVPGAATLATSLESVPAHCTALDVSSGEKGEIHGVCLLTDSDGDKIF